MGESLGGIQRSGSSGSYTYTTIAGRENQPVNYIPYYSAMRFANWMHNGQPTGAQSNATTEDGAYTITLEARTSESIIARNSGARIVLPTENEWYKAAYYDGTSNSYFDYPTSSDTAPTCSAPTSAPNSVSCSVAPPTPVGSYPGSPSPWGTFDQAKNIEEWMEDTVSRDMRSSIKYGPMGASTWYAVHQGIRVAMIPEPGTGLLVFAGLLGLAARRRPSA